MYQVKYKMFCHFKLDFGSEYYKTCRRLLKEIRLATNTKGFLYKNINTFVNQLYEVIFYMENEYDHVVAQELLLTLKTLQNDIPKLKFIEKKPCDFIQEDVEALEFFKQSVYAANGLMHNEKILLMDKLKLNNDTYKERILGRYKKEYDMFLVIEQSVTFGQKQPVTFLASYLEYENLIKKTEEIRRLLDSQVTFSFAKTLQRAFQDLFNYIKQPNMQEHFFKIVETSHQRILSYQTCI